MDNYTRMVEHIAKASGKTPEEVIADLQELSNRIKGTNPRWPLTVEDTRSLLARNDNA